MKDKSVALLSDVQQNVDAKKLTEALKALEAISILGNAEWKKYRAKEALDTIKKIKK